MNANDIDTLLWLARFGSNLEQKTARAEIRNQAQKAGLVLSSIKKLYAARATGEVSGFSVPAMNVRGMSYEFCRAIFRAAKSEEAAAFVIEIARSEMEYTDQRPDEIAVVALAAALREGYVGPIFLQGDHYKVKPDEESVESTKALIDESLAAGFYNIDIDASATINQEAKNPKERQSVNAHLTALLTRYIRSRQTVPVAVGGEIGEIGGATSTVEDLDGFMASYNNELEGVDGIGKLAIQTGTSHGGTPNADGTVAPVAVDMEIIERLGEIARSKYGLSGVVQHGASTLPADGFTRFPDAHCLEVHLSTEFQNIIFHHSALPAKLIESMNTYLLTTYSAERKDNMTDEQFFYKTRKHAWGPFKRQFAELPEEIRNEIGQALEEKVRSLFRQLRISKTASIVDRYLA